MSISFLMEFYEFWDFINLPWNAHAFQPEKAVFLFLLLSAWLTQPSL